MAIGGGARAVAITVWPRERSWETNSKPIPREAPTMSQVWGISYVDTEKRAQKERSKKI